MKRNPVSRRPKKIPILRTLILLAMVTLVIGVVAARSQTLEAEPRQSQPNPDCRANPFLPSRCPSPAQIEPRAGTWRTWVLEDGSQFRNQIPGPPSRAVSHEEIAVLQQLARQRDAAALDLINFWDAGGPAYRWNEIATDQLIRNNVNTPRGARAMALVNVAIYDAMIAAWDLKYLHKRPRPSELDPGLSTVLANPQSPSFPSEHAVAAGAASAVLAYLFPINAKLFTDQAEAAGRSRQLAGVQFPSDVAAGLELGRDVAELVIARARTDGSDAVFTGAIPTGPCSWRGTNPAEPMAGTWRTWALPSGSELRPGPPPTCDSAQMAKDLTEVKNFPRTIPAPAASFNTTRAAFYWQGNAIKIWHDILGKKLLEYRLDANPPRAARAYALFSVAGYDAVVAGWDAKYAYWAIRPFMLDPTVNTLFTTPNHPSYPSAHAFIDAPHAAALAYLFPRDADFFEAQSREGAESRIWAGIHFRSDIEAGLSLGRAVADFNRAIEANPRLAMAYSNRSGVRFKAGDARGAMADADRALILDPQFGEAWNIRGAIHRLAGNIDEALANFNSAIELDPRFVEALLNRGGVCHDKGRFEEAIADFDQAILHAPRDMRAWFNRGNSRQSKGDYAGAISDYTRAIELDPRHTKTYVNRGNARRANGDLAGAMNDYKQALSLDPQCALAFLNRGIGYLQQGREEEARRDFDQCLKIDPTLRPDLEATVGEAWRRLNGRLKK